MESLGVADSEQQSFKSGKLLWGALRQAKTNLRFAEPTDVPSLLGPGSGREMPQVSRQKSSRTLWNTVREKKPAQLRHLSIAGRSSRHLLSNSPPQSNSSNNDVPDAFLQLRTPNRLSQKSSTLRATPSSVFKSQPASRDISFRNVESELPGCSVRDSEEPGGLGAEAAKPAMAKLRRLITMRTALSRKSLSQDIESFAHPVPQAIPTLVESSEEIEQLRGIEPPGSMKDLNRVVMKAGKHSVTMPGRTLEKMVEPKAGKMFSWMKHGNSCAKTFRQKKKEKEAELARQESVAAGVVPEPEPEPEPEMTAQEAVAMEAQTRVEMAIDMVKLSEATNDPSLLRVDWMQKMIKSAIKIQTEWRSHRKRLYWKKLESLLGGGGNNGNAMMKRNEWGGWEMQEGQDIFAKPEKADEQREEGDEGDEEEGVWSGEDWEQSEEEPSSEEDPDAEEDNEDYGGLDEEGRERIKDKKKAARESERAARQEHKAARTEERARVRAERKAAQMKARAQKSARREAEREVKKQEALPATSGKPVPQKAATQVQRPKTTSSSPQKVRRQGKSQRQLMEHHSSATAAVQSLRQGKSLKQMIENPASAAAAVQSPLKGKSQKQIMGSPSSATAAVQSPEQGQSQKQMIENPSSATAAVQSPGQGTLQQQRIENPASPTAAMQSPRQGALQKQMMENPPSDILANSRRQRDAKVSVSFKAPVLIELEGATEEGRQTHGDDDAAQSPRSGKVVDPLLKQSESAGAGISFRAMSLPSRKTIMPLPDLPSARSSAEKAIKSLQFRVENAQIAIRSMRKITVTNAFSVADFRKWTSSAKWRFALVKTSVMDIAQEATGSGGKMDNLVDGMSLTSLSNLMEEVQSIQAKYSKASAAALLPQVSKTARRSIQAKLMQFQTWLGLLKEMTDEQSAGFSMLSSDVLKDAPLNPVEKRYFQQKAELRSMRPVIPSKSLKKPGGNPLARYRPSTKLPSLSNGSSDFSSWKENPLAVRGNVKPEPKAPMTIGNKRVIASGGGLQVEIGREKLGLSPAPTAPPISFSKCASKTMELEPPPANNLLDPARARDAVSLPRSVCTSSVLNRSQEPPGGTTHDPRRWESSLGNNPSRPTGIARSCSVFPSLVSPRQLKQKSWASTSFDSKPPESFHTSASLSQLDKLATRVPSLGEWRQDHDQSSMKNDETTPFSAFMREVRAKTGAANDLPTREHMPPANMQSQCSPIDVL